MTSAEPFIRCDKVSKSFGRHDVIQNLDLEIHEGEFISLLGPSGSGKTTLLTLMAGFENVTSGHILIGGNRMDELPPHRRNIGVVFQNYALFPHMTVAENVGFPLRMRGVPKAEIQRKITASLDMVELSKQRDFRPAQLSGGQQQRVALARALIFEPRVVLMDEPLGALDKRLREQMQLDIRNLHRRLGLTIVFVTHDQSEALTMSDRIAVFNNGCIEQIAPPAEVYDRPATRFVADFIGEANVVSGTVTGSDDAGSTIRLAEGLDIRIAIHRRLGDKVTVVVRPERMKLSLPNQRPANPIHVRLKDSIYHGDHIRAQLSGQGLEWIAKLPRDGRAVEADSELTVHFAPEDGWVLP